MSCPNPSLNKTFVAIADTEVDSTIESLVDKDYKLNCSKMVLDGDNIVDLLNNKKLLSSDLDIIEFKEKTNKIIWNDDAISKYITCSGELNGVKIKVTKPINSENHLLLIQLPNQAFPMINSIILMPEIPIDEIKQIITNIVKRLCVVYIRNLLEFI